MYSLLLALQVPDWSRRILIWHFWLPDPISFFFWLRNSSDKAYRHYHVPKPDGTFYLWESSAHGTSKSNDQTQMNSSWFYGRISSSGLGAKVSIFPYPLFKILLAFEHPIKPFKIFMITAFALCWNIFKPLFWNLICSYNTNAYFLLFFFLISSWEFTHIHTNKEKKICIMGGAG